MEEIVLLDAIERYLQGEMSAEELAVFEDLRSRNAEVDQMVVEHTLFLTRMQEFGAERQFRASLSDVHHQLTRSGEIKEKELSQGGKIVNMWKRYKRTIAVAASIAGITALLITLLAIYISPRQLSPDITILNRELKQVKQSQNELNRNQAALVDKINNGNTSGGQVGFGGTAFLLDTRGYLVTNDHILKTNSPTLVNNRGQEFRAEVVYRNEQTDIAILKVADKNFKGPAQIPYGFRRNSSDIGEQIYTMGYPRNEIVYGEGYLSAKTGYNGDTTNYQIAISANPGNSGGPLLNRSGEIIGVVSSKQARMDGFVFASKSRNILRAVDELRKNPDHQAIKLPVNSNISSLSRVQQIKKVEDCVYMVVVY